MVTSQGFVFLLRLIVVGGAAVLAFTIAWVAVCSLSSALTAVIDNAQQSFRR